MYVKLKKNDEAYLAFKKAIILKNNFAQAYSNRGDLNFSLKKYGSQGQIKSGLIALKLAEFEYLKDKKEWTPILLLYDI